MRRLWVTAAAVVVVASGGGAAAWAAVAGSHSTPSLPALTGHSIRPLEVYQRFPGRTTTTRSSSNGLETVSINPTIRLAKKPTIALHVDYANVRQVGTQWELQLHAPGGEYLALQGATGTFYDTVINGTRYGLIFEIGDPQHYNFAMITGTDKASALAIAHRLTSQVTNIDPDNS